MRSIVLIGYMCAGKTTIGKNLAKKIDRTFYDLDWYIEDRYHKKVADIFATEGEAFFRNIEQRMMHEVAAFEDIVLACGGGTPCFFDNMDYMNSCAETLYLKASPEIIMQHLQVSLMERPLLKNKSPEELEQYIREQLAVREPFYSKAKHILDIDILDSFSKIDLVVTQIKNLLSI
ncbi:MAG: shikimate kinase [Bacteroidaceae bacterium]